MIPSIMLTTWMVLSLLRGVTMLELVDLKVPRFTIRGQPVRLECHYDLQGEALYSVKWFKNNQEFFRFLPEDDPPAQVFRQQGVYVDLPNSSDTAVMLRAVDVNSTGEYRCEVSGEAPSFKTVTNQNHMTVVDLPDASGPQIDGVQPRYHIGDLVRVNCTSSRSRPAASLKWYINQEPAEEPFLIYHPIMLDEDGFQTSLLGLEFRVRQKHFKKGDLKLKCLATIDTLYWRSNEQSVEGDRPQKAPVLESRETFAGASGGISVYLQSSTKPVNVGVVAVCFLLVHYNSLVSGAFISVATLLGHVLLQVTRFWKGVNFPLSQEDEILISSPHNRKTVSSATTNKFSSNNYTSSNLVVGNHFLKQFKVNRKLTDFSEITLKIRPLMHDDARLINFST